MIDFKTYTGNTHQKLLTLWVDSDEPLNHLSFVSSLFHGLTYYDTSLTDHQGKRFRGHRLKKEIISWLNENNILIKETTIDVWFALLDTNTYLLKRKCISVNIIQFETSADYAAFRLRWL